LGTKVTTLSIYFLGGAQGCGSAPIFGDLSPKEKLSEIKPPLLA